MPATATATPPRTSKTTAKATTLTPHLVCRDAAGAIEFYKKAFGADVMRVVRVPGGGVMHAALLVREAMFFLCDECPRFGSRSPLDLGGTPVTLHLHVSDCDAVFGQAVAAGCTVRMPLQDMFWGDRYGVLSDPYGHTWSVATTVREVTTEEMQEGAAACAAAMNNKAEGCPAAGARQGARNGRVERQDAETQRSGPRRAKGTLKSCRSRAFPGASASWRSTPPSHFLGNLCRPVRITRRPLVRSFVAAGGSRRSSGYPDRLLYGIHLIVRVAARSRKRLRGTAAACYHPSMLVALTGASGFIGSYTAAALAPRGTRCGRCVRATSRRDHLAPFVSEWCVGDAADPQAVAGLVAGAEAVVHNAADWEALHRSPGANFEKNVLGSLRLLEAARAAGAGQFLFVSSVAVYQEILPAANGRIDETHPTWPGSLYGEYKAAVEPHLKAYHATAGMNTSSGRPAAVYGVDPDLPRSQWYELVRTARDGGTVDTPHGGKITHVRDVADALALAVGDGAVAGQFYNLVDRYLYWQQAAEFAKEITGSAATVVDRKGEGPQNQFDCAKAIAFFDRHGNRTALRRGADGVKAYVGELLSAMR